jgi:predicted metallopeptidase
MAEWQESAELKALACKVIASREEVSHVDPDEVLWLKELETSPNKALAKCYKFGDHPIGYFTDKPYAIVVYWQKCDYMSERQLAILLFHEMMHIPEIGDKLVDHDVQDFMRILRLGLEWSSPGADVPDVTAKEVV